MFSMNTTDYWHIRGGINKQINFCVWILLVDGLHVPPFDRHPDGDRTLRAAGLTADTWQTWLATLCAPMGDVISALDADPPRSWRQFSAKDLVQQLQQGGVRRTPNAPETWTGEPAVGERLTELWREYQPHYDEWWRRTARARRLPPRDMDPALYREFWRSLQPFHRRVPTLHVLYTEYPWPVSYVVPPISVLLGTDNGVLDGVTYATIVRRAVEQLANSV